MSTDFVASPSSFHRAELILRVVRALEATFSCRQGHKPTHLEILTRVALAVEAGEDASDHVTRVGALSATITRAFGLPKTQRDLIREAAPLHDVGKIGIPDHILLKPGRLAPDEFEQVKTHTTIGALILSAGQSRVFRAAEEIALYHHERWDGTGYIGLRAEMIPLAARVTAIADVFDVLTHERPYKRPWPVDQALAEIECERGRHFDPNLVDTFLSLRTGQSGNASPKSRMAF